MEKRKAISRAIKPISAIIKTPGWDNYFGNRSNNSWIRFGEQLLNFFVEDGRCQRADMHSAQNTILVYVIGFRYSLNVIRLGNSRPDIWSVEIGNVEFGNVSQGFFSSVHIVNAYEDDTLVLIFTPGLFQVSRLFPAGRTPRSPEVDDCHLAVQVT